MPGPPLRLFVRHALAYDQPNAAFHLALVQRILAPFEFSFWFSTWRRLSELGPTVIKNMGAYRYLFYMVGILGTAVVLSQFYNALVSGVFWLFYAAVIFPLAIGTLQFALMILLPPHTSET